MSQFAIPLTFLFSHFINIVINSQPFKSFPGSYFSLSIFREGLPYLILSRLTLHKLLTPFSNPYFLISFSSSFSPVGRDAETGVASRPFTSKTTATYNLESVLATESHDAEKTRAPDERGWMLARVDKMVLSFFSTPMN